jgi:hypothetical protein
LASGVQACHNPLRRAVAHEPTPNANAALHPKQPAKRGATNDRMSVTATAYTVRNGKAQQSALHSAFNGIRKQAVLLPFDPMLRSPHAWLTWGDDDLYPTQARTVWRASPTCETAQNKLIEMLYGDGIHWCEPNADGEWQVAVMPKDVQAFVEDSMLHTEYFPNRIIEYFMQNNAASRAYMENGKVTRLYRLEVESCRLQQQHPTTHKLMGLYYSNHFRFGIPPVRPQERLFYPLHRWYEHDAFMGEVARDRVREFALWTRGMDTVASPYALPRYQSLLRGDENLLNTEQRILLAANDLAAQYAALQYIVYVSDDYYVMNVAGWTSLLEPQKAAARTAFEVRIDELLSMQGGRLIVNVDAADIQTGLLRKTIEIVDLQDNVRTGKWLPDDSAITLKILGVLGTPYGVVETATTGGAALRGAGSDVKAGHNIGIQGNTLHQQYVTRDVNIAMRINGHTGRFMFVNRSLVDDNQSKTGVADAPQTAKKPKSKP